MITVYFDMDGVLVDLYGALAKAWGVPPQSLWDHDSDTQRRYELWIEQSGGAEEAFAGLPPNQHAEMHQTMVLLHSEGHRVEILTSLGASAEFDKSLGIEAGKQRWLQTHYPDLLEKGVLSGFNGVRQGGDKANFAHDRALLIDDSPYVLEPFRAAGGHVAHYRQQDHRRCMDAFLRLSDQLRKQVRQ